MRIGFDVDGVLANFILSYQRLTVQLSGRDIFLPGDDVDPPCWDWPQFRGYTNEEVKRVWDSIKANPTFWLNLEPMADVATLQTMITSLELHHEVYFVTSRVGTRVKRQSEVWLFDHLNYYFNVKNVWPTVLITAAKGDVARALKLDVYVDDNRDNAIDVGTKSPTTQNYLLSRHYNDNLGLDAGQPYHRVKTLGEVFDCELHRL